MQDEFYSTGSHKLSHFEKDSFDVCLNKKIHAHLFPSKLNFDKEL